MLILWQNLRYNGTEEGRGGKKITNYKFSRQSVNVGIPTVMSGQISKYPSLIKKLRGDGYRVKKCRLNRQAFSLIEVLVDVAIISLIITAVFSSFTSAYKSVRAAKSKITAVSIANEKMEIIRNMPYDDVGTTNNTYPPGLIPSDQEFSRNNINFSVNTTVIYVDDPTDGTIDTNPPDIYPYDYKKVEIRVRRSGTNINLVVLTTNIAAKAAETSTNTGILYLCVVDAENQPVSGATVDITNDDVNPSLVLQYETAENGCVMVPLLPPDSHNNYHLVVTKGSYSSAMTYPRTAQNPNEEHQDIDIIAQEVARVTMSVDKISSIAIQALDLDGNPVPNLQINLHDDFETYFNPITYRYSADLTLDANGQIIIPDLAFANYTASIISSGYYLSTANPNVPFYLAPDTSASLTLYITTSPSAPRITSISPASGKITDVTSIIISGENFDNSAVLKLVNPENGAEIIATNVDVQAHQEASGVFDLTIGSIGSWDVVVQNPDNEFARKVGGFEITN